MSQADDHIPERESDDLLAAEYVLGVLPMAERIEAARRIEGDAGFAARVDAWEVRLSPMAEGYAPVDPPASLKAAIERRLSFAAPATGAAGAGWWHSVAVWRGFSVAALVALAIAVAVPLVQAPSTQVAPRLVASLSGDASDVRYYAMYDAARSDVGLSHLSGDRGSQRDFELWVIEGSAAPRSLGVIPAGENVHIPVDADLRKSIEAGAVFAISLEPAGGSTTGAPTGPVVAKGDLRSI